MPKRDAAKIPRELSSICLRSRLSGLGLLLLFAGTSFVGRRGAVSFGSPLGSTFRSRIMAYRIPSKRRPMATLALGLPDPLDQLLTNRFLPSVRLTERHSGLAQGPAQSVTEPALVMLPLCVRPADSLTCQRSCPAQNSIVSELGKRSKGPISAAMIAAQTLADAGDASSGAK